MTELRHENPPHWGPDPGAVRSVPDTTRPYNHVTDGDKARRRKELGEEKRKKGEAIRKAEFDASVADHNKRYPHNRIEVSLALWRSRD